MKKSIVTLLTCCLFLTACGKAPEVSSAVSGDALNVVSEAYDYFSDTEDMEEILEELPSHPWDFILEEEQISGYDVMLAVDMIGKNNDFAVLVCNDGETCYNYCTLLDVSEENKCLISDIEDASLSAEASSIGNNDMLDGTSETYVLGDNCYYAVEPIIDSTGKEIGVLFTRK